jgi:uncharacterized protein YjcR
MSKNHKYRDSEWLREQYLGQKCSMGEIAKKCDCSSRTIQQWLDTHGIDTRPVGRPVVEKRLKDKEWLYDQYVNQQQSTYDIAEKCDCTQQTVTNWLHRHDIETRSYACARRVKADE